jgi:hypothetical protein
VRGGSVGPCIAKRAETRFLVGHRRERVQQVAGGARQPVEPGHEQHVAGVELVEDAAKLRPVGLGSARPFAEHLARPVLPQCRDLRRDALAVRRDARIAVNHGVNLRLSFAQEKPFVFNGEIFVKMS